MKFLCMCLEWAKGYSNSFLYMLVCLCLCLPLSLRDKKLSLLRQTFNGQSKIGKKYKCFDEKCMVWRYIVLVALL